MNSSRSTLLALLLFLTGLSSAVEAAPILSAPTVTRTVGDTFSIAITVVDSLGLTSFQFDIGFDPTIVELLDWDDAGTDFETAAVSGGGSLTGLTAFPLGSPVDELSGVADSISGLGSGLLPGGSLLFLQFTAVASGVSPLSFSCALCQEAFLIDDGVLLFSGNGDVALQDGQITVQPSSVPVPEPATIILLSTGVAALRLRARKPRSTRKS